MKILHQNPSTEFQEEEGGFILKVFVLGMKKNQIDVHIDGRYLWISARQIHTADFNKPYLLPDRARVDNVQAICQDGFLMIQFQKGTFKNNPNLIKVKVKGESKAITSIGIFWRKLKAIFQPTSYPKKT